MAELLVSVVCITYNQAEYIEEALESIICQKTKFRYEIIVYDDASTDGTSAIVKNYAERYPHKIRAILKTENQFSRGVWIGNKLQNEETKGKYIAVCEGDDYWCDAYKLQKQADYMEKHDTCSLCFHNARERNMTTGYIKETWRFARDVYRGMGDYSAEEMIRLKCVPTASMMFRKKHMPVSDIYSDKVIIGDMVRTLYLAAKGYGHCMEDTMSVYRVGLKNSATAVWSSSIENHNRRYLGTLETLENFDRYTHYQYHGIVKDISKPYQDKIIDFSETEMTDILNRFDDEESKKVFIARIDYLISNNQEEFLNHIKNLQKGWVCESLDDRECAAGKRKILLYGAGQLGWYNYNVLKLCRKEVAAFCDSRCIQKSLDGIPVVTPLQVKQEYSDAFIIISIKKGWEEVCSNLLQMDVPEENILYPESGRLCAVSKGKTPTALNSAKKLIVISADGEDSRRLDDVEIIQKERPILVVTDYYKQKDIIKIPQSILSIVPDYKLILRHETTNVRETVLYAYPPEQEEESIWR